MKTQTTGKIAIIDEIRVIHKDKNGKVISDRIVNNGLWHRFLCFLGIRHNSITNGGMAGAAGLLGNVGSVTAFTVIGIGTGTNTAGPTDTQLQTAVKLSAATMTRSTTTQNNDTLQFDHTFSAANDALSGSSNISEVGAFNGTVNGTSLMLLRQEYTPADGCNWDNGDTLAVTVKVKCEQGS